MPKPQATSWLISHQAEVISTELHPWTPNSAYIPNLTKPSASPHGKATIQSPQWSQDKVETVDDHQRVPSWKKTRSNCSITMVIVNQPHKMWLQTVANSDSRGSPPRTSGVIQVLLNEVVLSSTTAGTVPAGEVTSSDPTSSNDAHPWWAADVNQEKKIVSTFLVVVRSLRSNGLHQLVRCIQMFCTLFTVGISMTDGNAFGLQMDVNFSI